MQIIELMLIGFVLILFYTFCIIGVSEILKRVNRKPQKLIPYRYEAVHYTQEGRRLTPEELRSYTQEAQRVYSMRQREHLDSELEEEEDAILLMED